MYPVTEKTEETEKNMSSYHRYELLPYMALKSHVNFTAVIHVVTDNGLKVQILHFFYS